MRTLNPLKLIGTLDAILPAVQQVIGAVLPDFLHENLKDPEVRNQIVLVADQVLVKKYPQAKLIPEATRQRIIRKTLDMVLDDLLLPDELD